MKAIYKGHISVDKNAVFQIPNLYRGIVTTYKIIEVCDNFESICLIGNEYTIAIEDGFVIYAEDDEEYTEAIEIMLESDQNPREIREILSEMTPDQNSDASGYVYNSVDGYTLDASASVYSFVDGSRLIDHGDHFTAS